MGKITFTEKQEAIIRRLNDPLYTVEFLKEWVKIHELSTESDSLPPENGR